MDTTCHKCSLPVPPDSPGGLCPVCFWADLQDDTVHDTVHDDSGGHPLFSIAGHEVLEELARGGMGVVYRARQLEPRREVALKMLQPMAGPVQELRERFRIEARALAALDHSAILPLYQFGEHDGLPWFTMKLAGGGSLAARLKRGDRRPDHHETARLLITLAGAVHFAHQHGILHRDIKPGNILFDEAGHPYVADFGLAKLVDDHTTALTHTGGLLGTPSYMAPEVAIAGVHAATTSSDVYGLGAVLYELLAGRPPFKVDGLAAILKKIAEEEPEVPSTIGMSVPRDLEVICMTCLAKEQRRRYASAAALAEDLQRWLDGLPIAARPVNHGRRLVAWAKRKPALAATSAALILSLAGGSAWLVQTNRQLRTAVRTAQAAESRADRRAEFMLNGFADTLEEIGRVKMLNGMWQNLDADLPDDETQDGPGRLRRARLLTRWSKSLVLEGRCTEAAEKAARAVELASASLTEAGDHGWNPRELLFAARCAQARALAETGKFEEAVGVMDVVQSEIPQRDAAESHRLTGEAAMSRAGIFCIWDPVDREEETAAVFANAALAFRHWRAQDPTDPARTLRLAAALRGEASVIYGTEKEEGARTPAVLNRILPLVREASSLTQELCDRGPVQPAWEEEAADCSGWVGAILWRLNAANYAEARPLLEKELEVMSRLNGRDYLNWRWQGALMRCHIELARFFTASGDLAAARRHRRDAVTTGRDVVRQTPSVRVWAMLHAAGCLELATMELKDGGTKEATDLLAEARAVTESFILSRSGDASDQDGWRSLVIRIARIWTAAGNDSEAHRTYEDAISFCTKHADRSHAAWWRWTECSLRRRLAESFLERNQLEEAAVQNLKALEGRVALFRSKWEPEKSAGDAANSYTMYGQVLSKQRKLDAALESASAALETWSFAPEIAGGRAKWMNCIVAAASEALNQGSEEQKQAGRLLAARAFAEVYGPQRALITREDDKTAASRLTELAGTPPPALLR